MSNSGVLDVSFREDACLIRDRHAACVFAVLRKFAMNPIRQDAKSRANFKGRREQAAWGNDYMEQVLRSTFQDPPNQKSHQVVIRACVPPASTNRLHRPSHIGLTANVSSQI